MFPIGILTAFLAHHISGLAHIFIDLRCDFGRIYRQGIGGSGRKEVLDHDAEVAVGGSTSNLRKFHDQVSLSEVPTHLAGSLRVNCSLPFELG